MVGYKHIKKLCALYVEDDDDTREVTAGALRDFFADFVAVPNALTALDILETLKVDVIITDIRMPKMNGIEFVTKVRQMNTGVQCIVFTTAHNDTEYLLEAIKLKVDGFIFKPINLVELLDTCERNIRIKKQEKEIELGAKLIDALSIFIGGKKIEIIRHLIENADGDGNYFGSYEELMEEVNVSKPTVVATFKQLIDSGLMTRIKNRHYKWQAS